jgi:hypothetical protein
MMRQVEDARKKATMASSDPESRRTGAIASRLIALHAIKGIALNRFAVIL